jgi:hypothetical protein
LDRSVTIESQQLGAQPNGGQKSALATKQDTFLAQQLIQLAYWGSVSQKGSEGVQELGSNSKQI